MSPPDSNQFSAVPPPVVLGLRENLGQFGLLVLVNAFVGGMIGMERSILPAIAWHEFHLVARSAPQIPWGGRHGSGVGRARGAVALRTCAEPKVVTWDPPAGRAFWWHPYDETLGTAVRASAGLLYGGAGPKVKVLRDGGGSLLRTGARTVRGR